MSGFPAYANVFRQSELEREIEEDLLDQWLNAALRAGFGTRDQLDHHEQQDLENVTSEQIVAWTRYQTRPPSSARSYRSSCLEIGTLT